MDCGTATYLGFYAVAGVIVALYSTYTDNKHKALHFNLGLFPLGAAAIAETGLLKQCAVNILATGSAALLIIAVALLAFHGDQD